MVEDTPEDFIHDFHLNMIWKENPLGHPVLGNEKTIKHMKRSYMIDYINRYYHPRNIVISVAGNFDFSELKEVLNKKLGRFHRRNHGHTRSSPPFKGGVWVKKKSIEQVHFCLGAPGLPLSHEDRYTLYALNALLGGSMSSYLFQEIREKRGLVYNIYSYISFFMDTGLFHIYGATSKESITKVLALIIKELKKIKKNGITNKDIKRVKSQMKGSLMLGLESTSNRMSRLAKDELYMGRYFSPQDIIESIEKITPGGVKKLAMDMFTPEYMSLVILGPVDTSEISPDIISGLD